MRDLFTLHEAAKILGLTHNSVRRYNAVGILPTACKDGKDKKAKNLISLKTLTDYHHRRTNKKFDLSEVKE
jgi:hypothetical protein